MKNTNNLSLRQYQKKWYVGFIKAKEILQKTTQNLLRTATGLLTRQYSPNLLQLKYNRLNDKWYTDTLFSKKNAIKQKKNADKYSLTAMISISTPYKASKQTQTMH